MGDTEEHEEAFMLEMCSGNTSWQIEPREKVEIDLEQVGARIIDAGWEVTIQTRLCHIFEGRAKLTLFPSGKLLVKCSEKDTAIEIGKLHLTEWLAGV